MSAETLRKAAALMREENERARGSHVTDTFIAVAHWLEWEAGEAERFQAQTRTPLQMIQPRALAVARAYLGD